MEDKLHIARTEKEYREGLKNPSKNIMYFPNANQMTMKGMKTPIKYYGITNGQITDEGYAKPGQKFNVNGISTLEVRMPKMQYGGRVRYQTSGQVEPEQQRLNALMQELLFHINNNPSSKDAAIKNFADNLRTFHPSDIQGLGKDIIQMFGPNSAIKDEILKAGNFDTNGDYNPPIQGEYKPHPEYQDRFDRDNTRVPIREELKDVFTTKENSDLYSSTLDNNGFPVKGERVPAQNLWDLEKIGGGRSMYVPDNKFTKEHINQFDYDDPTKIRSFNARKNDNPFGDEFTRYPDWFDKYEEDNSTTSPTVTPTTNQPTTITPNPNQPIQQYQFNSDYTPEQYYANPKGLNNPGYVYPGYQVPDYIGPGKKYESVSAYQQSLKDFLKDNPDIKYDLAGINEGVENVYGKTTHEFMSDPTRKSRYEAWYNAKNQPQQTTTTPTQITTTPITTTPQDGSRPFGMNTLKYTDGEWYMTPSGSRYRTVGQKPSGLNFQLPDGTVVNSNSIPQELIDEAKKYPSAQMKDKLQQAYNKVDNGFNNFMNMINMDRADRAEKRGQRFLARAQQLKEIGNDRQAGKLLRKADKQFAKVEPLQRIQNANEARKDLEAKMDLDRLLKYKLSVKENRANEKLASAKAEALRTGEYWGSKGANKNSIISGNEARDRERTEGFYNRARVDATEEAKRNAIRDNIKDLRVEANQNYKNAANAQIESDITKGIEQRAGAKGESIFNRYDENMQGLKEDGVPTNNQGTGNTFWGDSDDQSYNIFRRKKEQGGYIPKYQKSGTFFSEGRNVTSPFSEPYQKHEVEFRDYSKMSPSQILGKATGMPGLSYSGQNFYGSTDPSFSLNYSEGKLPGFGVKLNYESIANKPLTFNPSVNNTTGLNKDGKSTTNKSTGKPDGYTFTPGEWTQFAGTMMPAFYNLAQSMRKPHKFKEFQNPYDGRYLSNFASQYSPYDDNKIVAQQNRVMRNAQQQAPNFQVAQAYQMAGMDSLNRQLKDYQMKNQMANQDYASKYNQAAHAVNAAQQAIKKGAYESTRQSQAALHNLRHKAMTQFGIGINDLGKLMVNREMNQMDWNLMGQIYQQYGLAPFEAVMSGKASWDDVVKFKGNPNAMGQLTSKITSYQQKPTQTTEDASNTGIDASVTTTTTPTGAGAAGGGYRYSGPGGIGSLPYRGTGKTGGKVFNLHAIKKC